MIDVLPRYPDAQLRMRVHHMAPGKEVTILRPQNIFTSKKYPEYLRKEFTDADFDLLKYGSPSVALVELSFLALKTWLNTDPLIWCQFGAKFRLDKMAHIFLISMYPYPKP